MYRYHDKELEVFLVHPGGPFWVKKDNGAWTLPKGEYIESEQPLDAARREFQEETGFPAPSGEYLDLGTLKQAAGKIVSAWAAEGDCDPHNLKSNLCRVEWPPHSGRHIDIPEVDRGAWFLLVEARERILKSQRPFLDELTRKLKAGT